MNLGRWMGVWGLKPYSSVTAFPLGRGDRANWACSLNLNHLQDTSCNSRWWGSLPEVMITTTSFFPFRHFHSIREGFLTEICGKLTGLMCAQWNSSRLGVLPLSYHPSPNSDPKMASLFCWLSLLCALEKGFFKDLNRSAILATSPILVGFLCNRELSSAPPTEY